MKLKQIVENIVYEAQDNAEIKTLEDTLKATFTQLGNNFKKNQDALMQDVQSADLELNESLTAVSVVGMILAAPKVVEIIVKSFANLIKVYKRFFPRKGAKTKEEQIEVVTKIIQFTHRWEKSYIKGLKWILDKTGMFEKVGITSDAAKLKAAELLYYTIIAGLALYSGVGAVEAWKEAIKQGGNIAHVSIGTLESAMAGIKTAEVSTFLSKLLLKV